MSRSLSKVVSGLLLVFLANSEVRRQYKEIPYPASTGNGMKLENPLVSVIITTRNRAALLREALESVLKAEKKGFTTEIIVVDDGSTDNTAEVIKAYPVHYIATGGGLGIARARNTGLAAAKGDFITILDDDDLWLPNNISDQLALFKQHPEYGAVHGRIKLMSYEGQPFGEPFPAGILNSGWILDSLLTYMPQVGSMLVKASAVKEVGGLDPSLFGDTDWDWFLAIAQKYPIGRVENEVILFRQRHGAEEELLWRRFPDTMRIFKRRTAHYSFIKRLRLQPLLWKHRGHYSSQFVRCSAYHLRRRDYKRAVRATYYALRVSPLHAAKVWLSEKPLAQLSGKAA
jgi:glycosyltransferase involved in cell wall biosynthesis